MFQPRSYLCYQHRLSGPWLLGGAPGLLGCLADLTRWKSSGTGRGNSFSDFRSASDNDDSRKLDLALYTGI